MFKEFKMVGFRKMKTKNWKELTFFVVLVGILAGCGSFQSDIAKTNLPDSVLHESNVRTVDKDSDVYFKGDIITMRNSSLNTDEPKAFKPRYPQSCFNQAYRTAVKKFKEYKFDNDTQYFEFANQDKTGRYEVFDVGVTPDEFEQIDPELLKEFDKRSGYLDSRALYVVKNSRGEKYLLMVGHVIATSGLGHLHRSHMLLPLHGRKPIVDFWSVTADPRKLWFDDDGKLIYLNITLTDSASIEDMPSETPLVVSLVSEDSQSAESPQFQFYCKDLMESYNK